MANYSFVVGVLEKADSATSTVSGLISVAETFSSDKNGYDFVVQTAQASTFSATVVGFSKVLSRSIPVFSIATNSYAATVTLFKIVLDVKRGDVRVGDVTSIVGNIAGIGLTIAVVASSLPASLAFLGLSVVANSTSVINSSILSGVGRYLTGVWMSYFKDNPSADYSLFSADPGGGLSLDEDLGFDYWGKSLAIKVDDEGSCFLSGIDMGVADSGQYLHRSADSLGDADGPDPGASAGGRAESSSGSQSSQSSENGQSSGSSQGLPSTSPGYQDYPGGRLPDYIVIHVPNDGAGKNGGAVFDEDASLPPGRVYFGDPILLRSACEEWYISEGYMRHSCY